MDLSRELVQDYGMSFVISLCLIFLISVVTSDLTGIPDPNRPATRQRYISECHCKLFFSDASRLQSWSS